MSAIRKEKESGNGKERVRELTAMDGQGAAIECNGEGPDVWVWHTAWRCSNVSYNCNINTQTICNLKKNIA